MLEGFGNIIFDVTGVYIWKQVIDFFRMINVNIFHVIRLRRARILTVSFVIVLYIVWEIDVAAITSIWKMV